MTRAVAELGLAVAALLGAASSWLDARSVVLVQPVADGQPATVSTVYDAQQLLMMFILAAAAGVLAVVGSARLARARGARAATV